MTTPPELAASSSIRVQAVSEHKGLAHLNYELLEAMRTFEDSIEWGVSQWAQDMEFLEILGIQRLTLLSANELALDGFYREAYSTTRMAFEGYLLLRLISTCDKYEFKYIVKRSVGDRSLNEAVAKVERQIRNNAGSELLSLKRAAKDILVAVRRGVPIVDNNGRPTGRTIPFYYNAWKQYRPEEHHLTGLKGFLERQWAIARNRRLSRQDPRHREFYREFFTFDGMIDKLQLNRVLTKKTAARVMVHYNFLSGYSHNTRRSIDSILNASFYGRWTPITLSYNHYHSELGLLYVGHLAAMFLDLVLSYFRRWQITVRGADGYATLVRRVQAEYGHFWSIFNGPHIYDRYVDANRLSDYRRKRLVRPEDVADSRVRYHDDPLNRVRELHCSTQELTTGNVYTSPFPRDDALRGL